MSRVLASAMSYPRVRVHSRFPQCRRPCSSRNTSITGMLSTIRCSSSLCSRQASSTRLRSIAIAICDETNVRMSRSHALRIRCRQTAADRAFFDLERHAEPVDRGSAEQLSLSGGDEALVDLGSRQQRLARPQDILGETFAEFARLHVARQVDL